MASSRISATPLLWLIVLAAGLVLVINMGIRQSFGLFLNPISLDLGLGRESFALSMALQNLMWGLTAPAAGGLADKYGAGRVLTVGALCYVGGLLIMANAAGEASLLTAGVLIGLGVSGTGFTTVLGVVGRAAPEESRAKALGLASMGSAIGMFAALPYVHVLIDAYGWSWSLVLLALTAAIMAPLGWMLASGAGREAAGRAASTIAAGEQTIRAALTSAMPDRDFRLLSVGFFVCGFHIAFVATHLPAFVTDQGFSAETGMLALMIIGIGNIAGTYLFGQLGGRYEKRHLLVFLYAARAAVFLAFVLLPMTYYSLLAYSAVLGLLWLATVPLTSGLVADMFGPRWMSMLFGITLFSHQIGSFLGAWLGGYLYDIFQSYDIMWWISIALGLISAIVHGSIRQRRPAPAGQAAS
ncbi:MFS transporter [Dichotomicrobium thermohalophilum]|uniref:Putative MFS family arabinose efflux permease n=1 Tax=Dichotomicrobium thermohalophilum TaxID=933063 RepID=A0A397Q6P2_9HYPH|nr:MFS transporter [Dichotomicrobium thermohalophilum]RIA55465.1 putative MFS family arabinose efflux permease [Dichotomicrobium thermohalophilum]